MRGTRSVTVIVAATVALTAVLSACSSVQSDVVPMPVPVTTASATPSGAPTSAPPADPVLLPGGSALANLKYFNFVNLRLLAVNSNPSSAAIIENLVNSGFDKSTLEITPDKTDQLRRPADSIQVSVRTSVDCLLGQFQAGNFTSAVGPPVNGTTCLIGATEDIS